MNFTRSLALNSGWVRVYSFNIGMDTAVEAREQKKKPVHTTDQKKKKNRLDKLKRNEREIVFEK